MPLYLLKFLTFTYHGIVFAVQWLCKMIRRLDFRTVLIIYLLFIIISLFCVVMQMRENGDLWRVETYFESPVSEIESESMTDVLSIFVELLNKNNLTYMMYGGTLLGSYRHMGRVPWDDDMDILIDLNQRSRLIKVLESLRPEYDLYIADSPTSERSGKWKFYKTSSKRFKLRPFSWPYVDIFFYRDNGTHLIDAEDGDSYPRSRIFPLHLRPFGSLWLNAPCDIEYVLADIEMDKCMSRSFSHYMELPIFSWSQRTVACSRLYHLFPFVQRQSKNNASRVGPVSESLKIGTYTLRRETVHRPNCLYNQKI